MRGRLAAACLACVLGAGLCACAVVQVAQAQDAADQAGASSYTVTFASNGGSAVASQAVDAGGTVRVPDEPVKTGFAFAGWCSDSACTSLYDFDAPVAANLVLYAKWDVASYTVSFETGGAQAVDPQQVEWGQQASEPEALARTGYTFLGWYSDQALAKPYDFSTAVYSDATLYAKWAAKVYGVRFVANGGTAVAARDVQHGKTVQRPQTDPTRQGYVFQGWYADADLTQEFDFGTPITANLKLYAKWARLYTVTFEANGGSEVDAQSVVADGLASEPDEPERAGYTFAGWCSDKLLSCDYDFGQAVGGDLVLYAKWVKDASEPIAFDDLVEPWSFTWVEQASARGLMSGYDDGAGNITGHFFPSLNISRGQVATVLWRIAGMPTPASASSFSDVLQDKFYTQAVAWCAEQGIVTGYQAGPNKGLFLPWAEVTREELATMVYRFAAAMGVTVAQPPTTSFEACIDCANVASWAHDAMVWCAAAGVITGKQTDQGLRLDAAWGATRAQAAKVFVQLDKLASGELYPYDDTDDADATPDPDPEPGDAAEETPSRPSGSVVDAALTYGVTADGFSYVVVPEGYADADGYAYVLDQAYEELGGRYVGPGAYILGYTGTASAATLPERVTWPVKVEGPDDMEVSGSIAGPSVVSANLAWSADDARGLTRLTSLSVARTSVLVQLSLAGNLVDGVALVGDEDQDALADLRFLDLSDTSTSAFDAAQFAALESLSLARCPLGAEALASLASWRGATGLAADLTGAGQADADGDLAQDDLAAADDGEAVADDAFADDGDGFAEVDGVADADAGDAADVSDEDFALPDGEAAADSADAAEDVDAAAFTAEAADAADADDLDAQAAGASFDPVAGLV